MSCDGKKPEAISQNMSVSSAPGISSPLFLAPRIPIVYCGTGPFYVEGPHSGEVYYFSPRKAEQLIEAADAAVLIETGLFRKQSVSDQIAALVPVTLRPGEPRSHPPHVVEDQSEN